MMRRTCEWRPSELAIVGGILILFVLHAAYLWTIHEDAFIGFRYVRHLVAGHGLVWNIGEPPVEGYTNFLWLMLLAGFTRLGADMPVTPQGLGTIAAAA